MLVLLALTLNGASTFAPLEDWTSDRCCCFATDLYASSYSSSGGSSRQEEVIDRRGLFRSAFGAAASTVAILAIHVLPDAAVAEEQSPTKPFASNEALLPAVRVKLNIDRAIQLANQLLVLEAETPPSSEGQSSANQSPGIIQQELERLLLQPQNYVGSLKLQGVPAKPAQQYLESYRPMSGDLPLQRYLIRDGDVRTWKALKRSEKEQERTNEIRAALNAYTDVLSFSGNSYRLNVDKQTKSSMVREGRLPELKQVITSDMGLRYLYRNQIITAMDDVRAELEYQLSQAEKGDKQGAVVVLGVRDLLELLTDAQKACDQWFSLIDPKDVSLAVETVRLERG